MPGTWFRASPEPPQTYPQTHPGTPSREGVPGAGLEPVPDRLQTYPQTPSRDAIPGGGFGAILTIPGIASPPGYPGMALGCSKRSPDAQPATRTPNLATPEPLPGIPGLGSLSRQATQTCSRTPSRDASREGVLGAGLEPGSGHPKPAPQTPSRDASREGVPGAGLGMPGTRL